MCEKEKERERERLREQGMEIARDTKVLRKSELYIYRHRYFRKNINSHRTEVKKRRKEREIKREKEGERERNEEWVKRIREKQKETEREIA